MQITLDVKAEKGALQQTGVCIESAPNQKKDLNKENLEKPINANQKSKFAGIAKKTNSRKKIASRSLVPGKVPVHCSDSDSDSEPHESSNMAIAVRRKPTFNNPWQFLMRGGKTQ